MIKSSFQILWCCMSVYLYSFFWKLQTELIQRNKNLFGENDRSNQSIALGISRLSNAKCKKAAFTIDSSGANTHGIPAHFVQDHSNPVDLVSFDINRPVEFYFNHGIALHLQISMDFFKIKKCTFFHHKLDR